MAYEPKHNFRRKDYLNPGDPDKIIYGSDLQDEFEAIAGDLSILDADNVADQADLDKEIQDRKDADSNLQSQIDSIGTGTGNEYDDTQIKADLSAETQARVNADNALDLRIDAVEDSITEDGGFVDAPNDGKLYGRQSEDWEEIVLTGGDSGIVYTLPILLQSGDEIQLPLSGDGEHLTVMLRAGEIELPLEAA